MNWDLWRSHGRIFALLFVVLLGRKFVSGICKLEPKKPKITKNQKELKT